MYVDKTALVYKLVTEGSCYFLNRPRRFGKSLLLSTLKAYFLGQKELFDGLAIADLETEWTTYPVLHFDFNARNYINSASLRAELNKHLELWEKKYGDEYKDREPEERFQHVIGNIVEQMGLARRIAMQNWRSSMTATTSARIRWGVTIRSAC